MYEKARDLLDSQKQYLDALKKVEKQVLGLAENELGDGWENLLRSTKIFKNIKEITLKESKKFVTFLSEIQTGISVDKYLSQCATKLSNIDLSPEDKAIINSFLEESKSSDSKQESAIDSDSEKSVLKIILENFSKLSNPASSNLMKMDIREEPSIRREKSLSIGELRLKVQVFEVLLRRFESAAGEVGIPQEEYPFALSYFRQRLQYYKNELERLESISKSTLIESSEDIVAMDFKEDISAQPSEYKWEKDLDRHYSEALRDYERLKPLHLNSPALQEKSEEDPLLLNLNRLAWLLQRSTSSCASVGLFMNKLLIAENELHSRSQNNATYRYIIDVLQKLDSLTSTKDGNYKETFADLFEEIFNEKFPGEEKNYLMRIKSFKEGILKAAKSFIRSPHFNINDNRITITNKIMRFEEFTKFFAIYATPKFGAAIGLCIQIMGRLASVYQFIKSGEKGSDVLAKCLQQPFSIEESKNKLQSVVKMEDEKRLKLSNKTYKNMVNDSHEYAMLYIGFHVKAKNQHAETKIIMVILAVVGEIFNNNTLTEEEKFKELMALKVVLGVSKRCCPDCAKIVDAVNEAFKEFIEKEFNEQLMDKNYESALNTNLLQISGRHSQSVDDYQLPTFFKMEITRSSKVKNKSNESQYKNFLKNIISKYDEKCGFKEENIPKNLLLEDKLKDKKTSTSYESYDEEQENEEETVSSIGLQRTMSQFSPRNSSLSESEITSLLNFSLLSMPLTIESELVLDFKQYLKIFMEQLDQKEDKEISAVLERIKLIEEVMNKHQKKEKGMRGESAEKGEEEDKEIGGENEEEKEESEDKYMESEGEEEEDIDIKNESEEEREEDDEGEAEDDDIENKEEEDDSIEARESKISAPLINLNRLAWLLQTATPKCVAAGLFNGDLLITENELKEEEEGKRKKKEQKEEEVAEEKTKITIESILEKIVSLVQLINKNKEGAFDIYKSQEFKEVFSMVFMAKFNGEEKGYFSSIKDVGEVIEAAALCFIDSDNFDASDDRLLMAQKMLMFEELQQLLTISATAKFGAAIGLCIQVLGRLVGICQFLADASSEAVDIKSCLISGSLESINDSGIEEFLDGKKEQLEKQKDRLHRLAVLNVDRNDVHAETKIAKAILMMAKKVLEPYKKAEELNSEDIAKLQNLRAMIGISKRCCFNCFALINAVSTALEQLCSEPLLTVSGTHGRSFTYTPPQFLVEAEAEAKIEAEKEPRNLYQQLLVDIHTRYSDMVRSKSEDQVEECMSQQYSQEQEDGIERLRKRVDVEVLADLHKALSNSNVEEKECDTILREIEAFKAAVSPQGSENTFRSN